MKRRVLFLCTGNSARSQMAEALLRKLAGEHFDIHSAGTEPREQVHPLAVKAMAEIGLDISQARPKDLAGYCDEPWDFVITVCDRANEGCPVFPVPHDRVHWSFSDPAAAAGTEEQRLQVFRKIRDEILTRLRLFVAAQVRLRV